MGQNSTNVNTDLLKQTMIRLADCNAQNKAFQGLATDTMLLHKEIDRKEEVILGLIKQRNNWKSVADSTQSLVAAKDQVIKDREDQLNKVNKSRRFGIGPYAGYGLMGVSMFGTSIGIAIHYDLIRW